MGTQVSLTKRAWIAGVTACALGSTAAVAAPTATAEPAPVVFPNPPREVAPFIAGAAALVAVLIVLSQTSGNSLSSEKAPGAGTGKTPKPQGQGQGTNGTIPGLGSQPTGQRTLGPDGTVSSVKDPGDGADFTNPGYDLTKPLPGLIGMTVQQARDAAARSINLRRNQLGLAPLEFPEVAMTIAENEAVILGKKYAATNGSSYRLPNTNNWVTMYPDLSTSDWWSDTVAPSAVIWHSSHADAPTRLLDVLRSNEAKVVGDPSYTHAGVGAWRNPGTGEWFFVYALLP